MTALEPLLEVTQIAQLRAIPLLMLFAAVAAMLVRSVRQAWFSAAGSALTGVAIALGAAALSVISAHAGSSSGDALGVTMSLLVAALGWVIVRYSRRYLEGEPGQRRYIVGLCLTLAGVHVVVLTDHLGVLVLAWSFTSFALHALLTFYRDRPAAVLAAHKKFLASRLAEVCLVLALLVVYRESGTLSINEIATMVATMPVLSPGLHAAMVLIALAAILKSAQLPVQGWLIQVMEAPTPVSALLHAGVVNLGGFVLLRLAPLLSAAPFAQTLLVVIGSLTSVLAGLVMMTRVSIKVRLAWSTCAQMGFMLVECGLGLYDLALLHLVAHSLYKAHAFLGAGETVSETRRRMLGDALVAAPSAAWRLALRLLAAPAAIMMMALSELGWKAAIPTLEIPAVALIVVGLGLAPLLATESRRPLATLARGTVQALLLTQLYILWHLVFVALLDAPATAPIQALGLWAAAIFSVLYFLQTWLTVFPQGHLSRLLYPWAYAGFFLDERFTRLTFRLWPLPGAQASSFRQ